MSVDTERDYTGIRCLRIGERSADSKMKETKDKTMWMWFGKHKKQIVLWSVIILIAVPLIVYGLSEISLLPVTGGNDWAGFWGGYMGAVIGGLCTFGGVSQTIKHEREKEETEKERSVLPYMGLLALKTDIDLYFPDYHVANIKEANFNNCQDNHRIQKYVFIFDKEKLDIKDDFIVAQIKQKDVAAFIPLDVENVGKGAAVGFRVGVHTAKTEWDKGKYTTSKLLKVGDTFNILLLFQDATKYKKDECFYLRIVYKNIFSQEYFQEYTIKFDEKHNAKMYLESDQKRIVKRDDRKYLEDMV